MVYLGGGTWVDIYLNSDDGAKGLKSEYGCAPMTGTESMNWYNFVERLAKSGKRLPNYAEFCAYMALCGLPVKKVWEKVREFLAKYTDELPDTDELDGDSTTGNVEEHRTQER